MESNITYKSKKLRESIQLLNSSKPYNICSNNPSYRSIIQIYNTKSTVISSLYMHIFFLVFSFLVYSIHVAQLTLKITKKKRKKTCHHIYDINLKDRQTDRSR